MISRYDQGFLEKNPSGLLYITYDKALGELLQRGNGKTVFFQFGFHDFAT